ncbi:hypothetical protein AFK68_02880 [Hydrocoleum sp. CS-953]|nr:hypothetical protein AFK68_02880 [Hydrocoleum sp. CS-953]
MHEKVFWSRTSERSSITLLSGHDNHWGAGLSNFRFSFVNLTGKPAPTIALFKVCQSSRLGSAPAQPNGCLEKNLEMLG